MGSEEGSFDAGRVVLPPALPLLPTHKAPKQELIFVKDLGSYIGLAEGEGEAETVEDFLLISS